MSFPPPRLAVLNPLSWLAGRSVLHCGVLSAERFYREVLKERSRASRRAIPFCVITIVRMRGSRSSGSLSKLAYKLIRNVRHTDQVGWFGSAQFGVLLVDTSEMGGRHVIDRLSALLSASGYAVEMTLRVHDPDGFGDVSKTHDSIDSSGNPHNGPDHAHDDADDDADKSHDGEDDLHDDAGNSHDGEGRSNDRAGVGVGGQHSVPRLAQNPFDFSVPFSGRFKRLVDIVGATLGLLIFGPTILIAMILVRWTSPGPAIFRQIREGRGGKPFTLYKIRTMCQAAESMQHLLRKQSHRDGPAFKVHDDPRITPIGRLFRATCVDELPQLWNVLIGDMSLVGPRPLPIKESRACQGWYRRRLDLKPGLTCYWQIDKANVASFEQWMRLDLRYVNESSFLTDLGLIVRTIRVPLTLRGNQ